MIRARWALLVFLACTQRVGAQQKLFTLLAPTETGVQFTNTVPENEALHIMNYEYLYNGHGIGVGDFNNDGLDDIFISGNAVASKLFLNKGNFRFEDITQKAGVGGNGTWCTGVSVADVNGDGLLDVYVCHSGKYDDLKKLANALYVNQGVKDGVPVFKEAAAAYGLDAPGTQTTMASFFDYDKDGDLDLFLLNHANHSYDPFENTSKMRAAPSLQFGNRLFKNLMVETGKPFFNDVTAGSGIINNALNYGLSVSISDLNLDGWPDIYTTSDYTEKDCYYINNGNGTFTESLQKSFTQISKYAMGSDIADCNNDGLPDVLTLDMLPEDNYRQKLLKGPDEYDKYHLIVDSGFYHQQMRNMLHLHQGIDAAGNARFSEVGQLAGVSNTDWSWSALWMDMDNDGWKDLFVTNGYLRDFTNMDFLKYTVAAYELEQAGKGKLSFKTYDLVKKMPSNKLANYAFHNNHNLQFSNQARAWGLDVPTVSNAAAYADFDNDGDLDLVVGNNNAPVQLYRNNATNASYLRVQLTGAAPNTKAIGARVTVYAGGQKQVAEMYTVRGYQSTVSGTLHFGLGTAPRVDSISIIWPKGAVTTNYNFGVDTLLSFTEKDAVQTPQQLFQKPMRYYKNVTAGSGINFTHTENDFIDFKSEVLLPWQLSRYGPALAKGDVNGDGLDDFFAGGAIGQASAVYVQKGDGTFEKTAQPDIESDAASEDVNAVFFDADGDGDADLYVVSGGNEYDDASPEYADRLYLNNGKGTFSKAHAALPVMGSSKLAVAAADYDGDGDVDLFVGGKAVPGSFPLAARSYLLRNDSKSGVVKFTDVTADVTADVAPQLLTPGMVSAALWIPVKDSKNPALVIAGDFMPLRFFENKNGLLIEKMNAGFENTNGFWSALSLADVNGDGAPDIVAGNCGTNLQYKATPQKPVTLYYGDFDGNGLVDPILNYYVGDTSYPAASRDELQEQMTGLRKKFVYYNDFARATITDVVSKDQIANAAVLKATTDESAVFINNGSNQFTRTALPQQAQFSRVSSIIPIPTSGAAAKLLLGGNFVPYRVQLGPADASMGVVVDASKDGLKAEAPYESGLYLNGDVRSMVFLKSSGDKNYLLVAVNNGPLQLYQIP